jgi:hypothetical protein
MFRKKKIFLSVHGKKISRENYLLGVPVEARDAIVQTSVPCDATKGDEALL